MICRTHLSLSFLFAFFVVKLLVPENAVVFVLVALFASLLPDIDSGSSMLGKHFSFFLRHRGFLHSFFAPAVLLFFLPESIYFLAFCIGYFSHLVGDMLTVQGVMPVYPVSRVRFSGFMATGSFAEDVFFVFLVALDIFAVLI
jgi:inner membrane protein